MGTTRTSRLGLPTRLVAVPENAGDPALRLDVAAPSCPSCSLVGPPLTYNLSARADRARVYEQVLREATDITVGYYIDDFAKADKRRSRCVAWTS